MPPRMVLIADDSRIFRALMSEVLRESGLDVIEAANGREALDRALVARPDLIILDALMPLLSGFDVLTRLREKAPEYKPVGVHRHRGLQEPALGERGAAAVPGPGVSREAAPAGGPPRRHPPPLPRVIAEPGAGIPPRAHNH